MFENEVTSVEEFIDRNNSIGMMFPFANVSIDNERSDYILFSPHRDSANQICPFIPVHKSRIESMHKLRLGKCTIPSTQPTWIANLVFKQFSSEQDVEIQGLLEAISTFVDMMDNGCE